MKYMVPITEIHKGYIEVEADSYECAKEKAEQEYWKDPCNYVLEPEDTIIG